MKLHTLLLASALISMPAFAQEAPKTEAAPAEPVKKSIYSTVLPVHIQPRQVGADSMSKAAADIEQANQLNANALGLYARVSEGGLGEDVWKDYASAQAADDLSKINLNFSSPTLWSLLKRALLTVPDAKAFADDKNGDVFSARLRTLIDIGSFDETVTLYKKLEGNVPTAKAALAGTEGIAGIGQTGVACLEEKALATEFKQTEGTSFWSDLNSFCKILLTTDTPAATDDNSALTKTASAFNASKKLNTPASLSELNGKSVIEVIAISKANLLPESLFTPTTVKVLKPEIISLLLKLTTSPSSRLSLLAVAAEKGMIERTQFDTEFAAQSKAITSGYWQPIFTLYNKAQTATTDTEKTTALKDALKTIGSSGNAALIPFSRLLSPLKNTDGFSAEESRKVISLLIRSKTNVSGAWAAKAFKIDELKLKESVTDSDVVSYLQGLKSSEKPTPETKDAEKAKEGKKTDKKLETIENPQLYAVSLILRSEEAEDKITEKSYEKLLSLTPTNDYVMPSKELMNNLTESASKQDTGKIILYSLQILNGQRISQIHPAALFRISEGFESVGLSEEDRSLAHEVLADLIEEYKN